MPIYARTIAMFTAVAAMLLPAGGCGDGDGDAGMMTVTVWAHHGRPEEHDALQRIIAAFNAAHADEKLRAEITFFPDPQYADKVSIAAAGGSLPDVLEIDGPLVGPWAAEGVLSPLDDLVDAELRADMLPSLIEQGTYDGKLYALGAFDSALVVYYNREMIRKAGLDPPQRIADAWSWDEFVAALRAVEPYAAVPLSLHMDMDADEWFTYAFAPLVWSNGGRLIDTDRRQALGVLNGDAVVEAVAAWQKLFADGLAEASTTNPDPFSAGLAAFDWTGHWMLPQFRRAPIFAPDRAGDGEGRASPPNSQPDDGRPDAADARSGERGDDYGFGVMPLPKLGEFVAPSGSWCWGLARRGGRGVAAGDGARRRASWRVIEWLLDPEHGIKPMVEANSAVPGRTSAFRFFPQYDQMPWRLFREQLEQAARARPRTPVYLTLSREFAAALRDVARGADPRERLTDAARQVQQALDRMGG